MSVHRSFIARYFICLFFVIVFLSSGHVESEDGWNYLALARRVYYDHTFEMPVEVFPENVHMGGYNFGRDGKRYASTGIGFSLAYLPAVFLEDVTYRLFGLSPNYVFPINYDWPLMLYASMTNAFYGALIVTVMYQIFRTYGIDHSKSLGLSLITGFASNLLPYFKHAFPHAMFISFFLISFLNIRKWAARRRKLDLFISGVSYGLVVLTYNATYLLLLPFVGFYLLLHGRGKSIKSKLKCLGVNGLVWLAGTIPFYGIYRWYNFVRYGNAMITGYGKSPVPISLMPDIPFIYEGLWGLLFSPGKSIFIFSPLLLVPLIFWQKYKKKDLKEIIPILILCVTYLYFISILKGSDYLFWHGDASYGPRYLTPLIPMIFVLIGIVFSRLKKWEKISIFWPLVWLGILLNVVGVLVPYQVRFAGLEANIYASGHRLSMTEYGNIIPRFSPVYTMTKTLLKRVARFGVTHDRGEYKIRLKDGFGYINPITFADGREMFSPAILELTAKDGLPLKNIELKLQNMATEGVASYAAQLSAVIEDKKIAETKLAIGRTNSLHIPLNDDVLKEGTSQILLSYSYEGTDSAYLKSQTMWLMEVLVDNQVQPMKSLDYPLVSPISRAIDPGITYAYWGGRNTNLWDQWSMRNIVYENTFDIWWMRHLYIWDLPKEIYIVLFLGNVGFMIVSFMRVKQAHNRLINPDSDVL